MKKVLAILMAAALIFGMLPGQTAAASESGQQAQSWPRARFSADGTGFSMEIGGIKDLRGGSYVIRYNPEVIALDYWDHYWWVDNVYNLEPGILKIEFKAVGDKETNYSYSLSVAFKRIGYGTSDIDVESVTAYDGAGNNYEIEPEKSVNNPVYDDPSNYEIEDGVLIRYLGDAENLELPDDITVIGEEAFAGNTTLAKIRIPYGVTEVRDKAFLNCKNLSALVLPEGVTKIGYAAVAGCEKLEKMELPKGIEKLDTCIFSELDHMEENVSGPVKEYYKESFIKELTIKSSSFELYAEAGTGSADENARILQWEQSLKNLETVFGYVFTGAEDLAKDTGSRFVSIDTSFEDRSVNKGSSLAYRGDVDGNGSVDAQDALEILKSVVGLTEAAAGKTADVNDDETVDSADALQVLEYAVNLRPKQAVAPKIFETYQFASTGQRDQWSHGFESAAVVLKSAEERDRFVTTYLEDIFQEDQQVMKEIQKHFQSLDEDYFKDFVCVVTFDTTSEKKKGDYKLFTLRQMTSKDGALKEIQPVLYHDVKIGEQENQPELVISTTTLSKTFPYNGEFTDTALLRERFYETEERAD